MGIPVPGDALFAQRRPYPRDYLTFISIPEMSPRTSAFDPGCDPVTLESHLDQSGHLISSLKISMTCWIVSDEIASRRKIAFAARRRVPVATGGGLLEIAAAQGQFAAYIDFCADDVARVPLRGVYGPDYEVCGGRRDNLISGLEAPFELGKKLTGAFTGDTSSNREIRSNGKR